MLKKIVIAGVAVLIGLAVLSYTDCGSYIGLGWKKMKDKARNAVPPEVQIERLRHDLTQLEPEMKKNRSALAQQLVELDMLTQDINKTEARLKVRFEELQALKEEAKSGVKAVSFDGRKYSNVHAQEVFINEWATYKTAKESLDARKKLLEAKTASATEAKKALANWAAMKAQREAELDQIEAELRTVRLAQERNHIEIDHSRLSRFNSSVTDLKKRVAVMQKELQLQGEFGTRSVKVEDNSAAFEKALKEIDEHIGKAEVAVERK